MTVRAKFKVTEVRQSMGSVRAVEKNKENEDVWTMMPVHTVTLSAVNDEENRKWAQLAPTGVLTLAISDKKVATAFELGASYFLEFTPAPVSEAEEG